ncbi:hypothetical protein V8Z74_18170 [Comamonas sp. w2-DMI]|uniref:hypothetical protein n=1 Tax=Comamonas sp. w2-DMI TaxID=3126391 RepID=UPI0032E3B6CA
MRHVKRRLAGQGWIAVAMKSPAAGLIYKKFNARQQIVGNRRKIASLLHFYRRA